MHTSKDSRKSNSHATLCTYVQEPQWWQSFMLRCLREKMYIGHLGRKCT